MSYQDIFSLQSFGKYLLKAAFIAFVMTNQPIRVLDPSHKKSVTKQIECDINSDATIQVHQMLSSLTKR